MEFYCSRCDKNVVIEPPQAGQQAICPVCSFVMAAAPSVISQVTSPATIEFIYCQKCGQQNKENNFKCTRCGFVLHSPIQQQYVVVEDGTVGGLIPYKNPKALWAYYLGLFSLIPCFGIFLGVAAFVLGTKGLKYAKSHSEARGEVHAWVGIIMGGLCILFYVLLLVLITIGILNRQ
jgi:DNA-directed RNA polymerase subunit RPC12/RpoP